MITLPNDNRALLGAIRELINTIEDLDVSIDYLSAAVSGYSPIEIGTEQSFLGRYATPVEKAPAMNERRRWSKTKEDEAGGCGEWPSSDSGGELMVIQEPDDNPMSQIQLHGHEQAAPYTSHREESDELGGLNLNSILNYITQLSETGML